MEITAKKGLEDKISVRFVANVIAGLFTLCSIPFCLCDVRLRGGDTGEALYRLAFPPLCVLLLLAEDGLEKITKKYLPDGLYAFTRMFAVGALVLGRACDFYALVPFWDKILHTLSGVMFTLIGFCIAPEYAGKRKTLYIALFALLFSLSVGYAWELLEFGSDALFGLNSQRWQSGLIADLGNGLFVTDVPQGSGLIDSMTDMLVNLIGTLVTLPFARFFGNGKSARGARREADGKNNGRAR